MKWSETISSHLLIRTDLGLPKKSGHRACQKHTTAVMLFLNKILMLFFLFWPPPPCAIKVFVLFKYLFKSIKLENKMHKIKTERKLIHHSASFRWECKFNEVTHFWSPHRQRERPHYMEGPVEMLFSMIQSILSCPFHMLPMNYVSAVIYGAPCSTVFLSLNVESYMDFSPGANWENQNCSI